jgi:hypothetical protein
VIRVGDVVRHSRFGTGTVTQVRGSGYDARVDFYDLHLWVPTDKLELVEQAGPVGLAGNVLTYSLISRPEHVDFLSRHLIESFRLGIVPDFGVKEWTVGRDAELARLAEWLADEGEGSLLIEGKYGSGKTHLLRYLAQAGLEKGYAVSYLRINPGQENASFPYRFFAGVMHALRLPFQGATTDIRTAFREGVLAHPATTLDDHVFFGPFIAALRRGNEDEREWLAFLGERVHSRYFPSSLNFTTVANLACNQLAALSHFLVQDLKLAGMLVLVDEVETAEVRRYTYHWVRTLNFLRGLTLVANDDPDLEEGAVKGLLGTRTGERTGLVYSGHHPDVRYYHRLPTFLKCALALTECRVFGKLRDWKQTQPVIPLSDIEAAALRDLFGKVAGVYCALHGIRFPVHLERWALHDLLYDAFNAGSIRGFMKALIETLDFLRHHPSARLEDLQTLKAF